MARRMVVLASLCLLTLTALPAAADPSSGEESSTTEALGLVRRIRQMRESWAANLRAYRPPRRDQVGSEAMREIRATPSHTPWPEGPLLGASATEDSVLLTYGSACHEQPGQKQPLCIHELRLGFVRVRGTLKLVSVRHHGW